MVEQRRIIPMIHVIMGLKGSGKTKKLIDSIHEAVEHASGVVACIQSAWWMPRSTASATWICSRAS